MKKSIYALTLVAQLSQAHFFCTTNDEHTLLIEDTFWSSKSAWTYKGRLQPKAVAYHSNVESTIDDSEYAYHIKMWGSGVDFGELSLKKVITHDTLGSIDEGGCMSAWSEHPCYKKEKIEKYEGIFKSPIKHDGVKYTCQKF